MKDSVKNKRFQSVGTIILVLTFIFASVAAASPVLADGSTNQATVTAGDNAKIKAIIKNYFTQRYEAQKGLTKPANYSSIYASAIDKAPDQVWLQREKDRLEILLTIAQTTHFNFTAYKFSLNYQGIKVSGNRATVKLLESNQLTYPGSSEPSLLGDLAHTVALKKNSMGKWLITKDDYLDDTLRSMAGVTKADVLKTIHNNFSAATQRSSSKDSTSVEPNSVSPYSSIPTLTSKPYSASMAKGFADAHYNKAGTVPPYVISIVGWDSTWKTSFKLYPGVGEAGDCTNFVSQAIFYGSDYTASDANYFAPNTAHINDWWYYDFSGSKDTQVGGSAPWIRVGALYNFLTTNTGRGPYGVKVGNPATGGCGLVPGDVIMMKNSANAWAHSVFVRASDPTCAYAPYAWVDAHSSNVRNAPLANYLGFTWFPVHITSYRE